VLDDLKLLIGGEWVDSASGATFEATSPSTGEVIARVPQGRARTHSGPLAQRTLRGGTGRRAPRSSARRLCGAWRRVGGRFSMERLTELKTVVVGLDQRD